MINLCPFIMLNFISQPYLGGTMVAYITVGATTTHGGKVISGSLHTTHYGLPISRKGDKVICKKCKKMTTILTGDSSYIVDGAPVARAGDATSCGAKLIAVQQSFGESDFEVGSIESDPEEIAKWADDAVAEAEEEGGLWAGPPMVHRNPDGSLKTEQSSPLSSDKNLNRSANSVEMYQRYRYGKGEALTLENLGSAQLLKDSVLKEDAYQRESSIQDRFIQNDLFRKFQEGDKNYTFSNSYDVGKEIDIWAYGSSVISGKFNGTIEKNSAGGIRISGKIDYRYTDEFQDPYDTFDNFPGSWDPNCTPYKITGSWTNYVNQTIKK